jgi:hypothetical protein
MGWQRCKRLGTCPKPGARSNVVVAREAFSTDFDVSARDGKLWARSAKSEARGRRKFHQLHEELENDVESRRGVEISAAVEVKVEVEADQKMILEGDAEPDAAQTSPGVSMHSGLD